MAVMMESSTSEDKILYGLKTRGQQTAAALGQYLGMTSMGARQHLLNLAQQGLVLFEDKREAVGRPKRHWQLTEQGHARFPDSHAQLTVELLNSVRTVFGEDGLERLIERREQDSLQHYQMQTQHCATWQEKVQTLAKLRAAEGYMAESQERPDGSYLLLENHCPIRVAAQQCQGFCRSELEIFQAVVGADADVVRLEHILAGARRCAYRIVVV